MDDDGLADVTPNCPRCLVPLEAVEIGDAFAWRCPSCGLARL